jgi:hypothetical protein
VSRTQELTSIQVIACQKCHRDLVTKMDAIGRTTYRCPTCDGVSKPRPRHPDEACMPQSLVKMSASALPRIALGQLRCQQCAQGVEGRARLCERCLRGVTTCVGCGSKTLRARGGRTNSSIGSWIHTIGNTWPGYPPYQATNAELNGTVVESGMSVSVVYRDAGDDMALLIGRVAENNVDTMLLGYIEYEDDAKTLRRLGFCRRGESSSARFLPVQDSDYEYAD